MKDAKGFKSKRYRDKLRTEVKALEALLPVDRTTLSRKLDSQTVFRLVIAFLRTKGYCQAVGLQDEAEAPPQIEYKRTRQRNNTPSSGLHVPGQNDPQELIKGTSCLQVLDGFLLLLTADGTILYVSDNVLQYLGYNQVDLMHRCLYSIIHQDDMLDLKIVLESSFGHLVTQYDQHDSNQEGTSQHLEDCSIGGGDTACKPVSFICRMRCFSGSSVGYLKMHCSGKLIHVPGLVKSKRFSGNVVLLFCNPFMLRAAEFTTDLQKNVFWSKHDLDLNIKEIDKKGADIIGFDTEELEKRSFYSLIHPEDLTTLVSCHRMLVESTEVQTVYFRLQTKGGDWVWLTSRGKVISKNSKKFSIAFSHCPLREEDSTYIQQEAVLRRRYAISDLMCMSQFKQSTPPLSQQLQRDEHMPASQKAKRTEHNRYHPYYSQNNGPCKTSSGGNTNSKADSKKDSPSLLDTSCIMEVACPSAWHALSDRHSPVLPSSHVAHKISQREKQLQFQEFCRHQQLEMGAQEVETKAVDGWDVGQQFPVAPGVCGMPPTDNLPAGLSVPTAGSGMPFTGHCGFQLPGGQPSDGQVPIGSYPGYSFMPVQTAGAPYMTWQNGSASCSFVETHSPVTCLTPSRSPHQNRGPASHAALSALPAAYTPQVAPYDSVYSHTVACSSMPPSPPPSPPNFHRPVPSYQCSQQDAGDACAMGFHDAYNQRPVMHPYFPYQTQQPPPYPKKNSKSSESTSTSSTITDLQRTTEKFLQVKEEASCDSKQSEDSASHHQASQLPDHRNSCSEMWYKPSWAFSSCAAADRQVGSTYSVPGHSEIRGMGGFPQPYSRNMDFSFTYLHSAHADQQTAGFPATQSLAYSTAHRPPQSLGSPPAYPYAIYSQTAAPGPQIHMNGFYGAQVVPVKTMDFTRPGNEHVNPLDLPSIGSFLEYLNEV